MRIYLDCYPCFLRQALQAARIAGADEDRQHAVLDCVMKSLHDIGPGMTPPEIGDMVHRAVRSMIDGGDPYRTAKDESTAEALRLYDRLVSLVRRGVDPLERAIRISIAGNILDFAPNHVYDLWETVERVVTEPMAIDDTIPLKRRLAEVNRFLFLGDNAGETVFDRVLIETIGKPAAYAVKGGPVLNDATLEDAEAAGLREVAELVSTGSDAPGTVLERCDDSFRQRYDDAELVIAKGQANYETLSDQGPKVFFLLQVKCPVIADDIGMPMGGIVVKQGSRERT